MRIEHFQSLCEEAAKNIKKADLKKSDRLAKIANDLIPENERLGNVFVKIRPDADLQKLIFTYKQPALGERFTSAIDFDVPKPPRKQEGAEVETDEGVDQLETAAAAGDDLEQGPGLFEDVDSGKE